MIKQVKLCCVTVLFLITGVTVNALKSEQMKIPKTGVMR